MMSALEVLSSPKVSPYWVSALYDDQSLRSLSEDLWRLVDSADYASSKEEEFQWLDIGSGSGLYVEDGAVRYPEEHGKDSSDIFAEMLDMAPPEYAKDLSEEHSNINLIQGTAPDDIPDKKYDFVSLVNTGQYFNDDEFSELVDEVYSSLKPEGHFLFTSVHPLVDLFRELEEFSDRDIVRYVDGCPVIETPVSIDKDEFNLHELGIDETLEGEIVQSPRRFTDYLMEILGGERFSTKDVGAVEAFTEPKDLIECIEGMCSEEAVKDNSIKNDPINYPLGIVEKTSDNEADI